MTTGKEITEIRARTTLRISRKERESATYVYKQANEGRDEEVKTPTTSTTSIMS